MENAVATLVIRVQELTRTGKNQMALRGLKKQVLFSLAGSAEYSSEV
jgi:hypothetical protein